MAYLLSATKLKSYAQCPSAYYLSYEYGLKKPSVFGAAVLGTALHGALAQLYQDWHYRDPLASILGMVTVLLGESDWCLNCGLGGGGVADSSAVF